MTTTLKTKPSADLKTARRNLARLRDTLVRADSALVDYWLSDEWRAFGHKAWRDFVAAELPQLRALSFQDAGQRDEKLRELVRDHGMSMGAAAEALGVGKATAHRALAGVQLAETNKASDGRTMAARTGRAPVRRKRKRTVPLTDQVVALLIDRGPLDVLEVTHAVRQDRSMVSPTLTRLQDAGRIQYLAPERRGQFGRWTVAG